MNAPRFNARDRRALAAGVVTVVALVIGARGGPALRRWQREVSASHVELRGELARAERSVRGLKATQDSLLARRARLREAESRLLRAESATGAAATLSSRMADAAVQAGVRLGAVQVRIDTTPAGPFVRVMVRADVTGDVRGILTLLSGIERGPLLLAIRALSITQPEPAAASDRPEVLRVEMVVEGLAQTVQSGQGGDS